MIFNVNGNSESVDVTAEKVKYGESDVAQALNTIEDELTANGQRIYLDYKDGKYGYNTDALRGADTFSPFRSGGSGGIDAYTNLTTVDEVTGDNLPTINGSGYITLKFKSGTPNGFSVYIDGNTSPFNVYDYRSSYYAGAGNWTFYFQESISFANGKSNSVYLYQTLLADSLVDKKYNIRQGSTHSTNPVTINDKGKIIISLASTGSAEFNYNIDGKGNSSVIFYSCRVLEFMFDKSFVFSSSNTQNTFYYIAYIEL